MPKDLLPKGLYDLLTPQALKEKLDASEFEAHTEKLDSEDSHRRLADALAEQLSQTLAALPADGKSQRLEEQVRFINELLVVVQSRLQQEETVKNPDLLEEPLERLTALSKPNLHPEIPRISLSQPWLFTAGKDSPPLLHELSAELAGCNTWRLQYPLPPRLHEAFSVLRGQ